MAMDATQYRQLIMEWAAHLDRQGVAPSWRQDMMLAGMARIVGDVLGVQGDCGEIHPLRPSIVCTQKARHAVPNAHYNEHHRLSWDTETVRTFHDELGELTLEPEPEPQRTGIPSADAMLDTLRAAMAALAAVENAYNGTSRRITASIYRRARDARDSCVGQEAALLAGIKAVADAQAS